MKGHSVLFPVSQFQTSICDADCSLSGEIGLPFPPWSSGDKCRQRTSYRGLSIDPMRGRWFLVFSLNS